mgnify:CR=1 FL=1
MSWKDQGFNNLLTRELSETGQKTALTQDDVDSLIEGVSGSKITSGISRSKDGLLKIDWDKGTITLTDGTKPYFVLGKQDDGTRGFRLLDTPGNQVSVSMIELNLGKNTVLPGGENTGRLYIERIPASGKLRLVILYPNGDQRIIATQL